MTALLAPVSPTCELVLPCHRHDPDLWFSELPDKVESAKTLCSSCPIRAECLGAALDRNEPWGVWGGELLSDGAVVPRKRPRGRPRKADAAAWEVEMADLAMTQAVA